MDSTQDKECELCGEPADLKTLIKVTAVSPDGLVLLLGNSFSEHNSALCANCCRKLGIAFEQVKEQEDEPVIQ